MNDRDADVGMRLPVSQDALRFVILLGVTSLFADMTYEGARSITGPYLGLLGASATAVGVISGFGELIGYALRWCLDLSPTERDATGRSRCSATPSTYAAYGIFWFLGSALMGFLYDTSLLALIGFSVGMQLAAVPLLIGILVYDRK